MSLSHRSHLKIIFLFLCINMIVNCSDPKPPAEQQILDNTKTAIEAIEQLKPQALREILAPNFEIVGSHKYYDYALIKKTMMLFSFRKQKINIMLSSTTATLDPYNSQLASMTSTAVVTGGKGLLPEDGRIYKVTSEWRLYDSQWRITNLNWK